MLPPTKPEVPKANAAGTSPTTSPTASPAASPGLSLHDRVMADAQNQAAQGAFSPSPYLTAERYRRLSWGFEQRRDSNPLSRGINP
jgi:hypothetical protein